MYVSAIKCYQILNVLTKKMTSRLGYHEIFIINSTVQIIIFFCDAEMMNMSSTTVFQHYISSVVTYL